MRSWNLSSTLTSWNRLSLRSDDFSARECSDDSRMQLKNWLHPKTEPANFFAKKLVSAELFYLVDTLKKSHF
jgi:hypothetical protein